MEIKRKNAMWVPESVRGVCLWEVETSTGTGFLAESPGVFLCAEGVVNDKRVEAQVEAAARYWLGAGKHDYIGKPYWVTGARKVTNNEHDDQMERMLSGDIPDWEEEMRLAVKDLKKGK